MSDRHMKDADRAWLVWTLMNTINDLDASAKDRAGCEALMGDEQDLALAYAKLGRLVTRLRFPILQAAE